MNRALSLTLPLVLGLVTSASSAGILPDGFNILCQVGDGGVWQATNNPNDFQVKQTDQGATIWGASATANWGAEWDAVQYTHNPSITLAFSFTNNTGSTQSFTLIFITPGSIAGPTFLDGSVTGGLTDGNQNGATIASFAGFPVYTALIDGNPAGPTLFDDPYSVSTGSPPFTAPLGFEWFDGVIGAGVSSDIGIRLRFTLTAGDSVTFNAAFRVQEIPAPAGLAAFGLLGLLGRRRRR
jgi:hypothetical protein